MDPRNGKILAMVSLPGYDNNLFAKGVTTEAWDALTSNPDLRCSTRPSADSIRPARSSSPSSHRAALQEGVINSQTLLGDGFDGSE